MGSQSGSLWTFVFQNLNKQAYDLAKALLKRTAQAIEPYITNVSPVGCLSRSFSAGSSCCVDYPCIFLSFKRSCCIFPGRLTLIS